MSTVPFAFQATPYNMATQAYARPGYFAVVPRFEVSPDGATSDNYAMRADRSRLMPPHHTAHTNPEMEAEYLDEVLLADVWEVSHKAEGEAVCTCPEGLVQWVATKGHVWTCGFDGPAFVRATTTVARVS